MDKKSLYLCLILFVISMCVGLGVCVVIDTVNDDEIINDVDNKKEDNDEDIDVNNIATLPDDSLNEDEKPATDVYEKKVHYSGDYVDLSNYIIEFDNDENNNDKLFNLVVDGIKLDGDEYIFSFKNHPNNCDDLENYTGYNEFYINDKLIYTQNNQACYLERVQYLTIIDNKYIFITYSSQGGDYVKVYDKDINLVDTFEYFDIEIKKDEIVYSEYVSVDGCYLNYFKYDIVDGKIVREFKKNVKNNQCNQITGEGCNCDEILDQGIKFGLKNENETYIFDRLTLYFNGNKTGDINNEDSYQYTLDMLMNGKKVDSSIFGNKDNKVIWSSNYAASFKIVNIDDYYILISSIAVQNGGEYVLVMDKEGNVVKTFENVLIVIDKNNSELKVTDCKSISLTSICPSKTYSLK